MGQVFDSKNVWKWNPRSRLRDPSGPKPKLRQIFLHKKVKLCFLVERDSRRKKLKVSTLPSPWPAFSRKKLSLHRDFWSVREREWEALSQPRRRERERELPFRSWSNQKTESTKHVGGENSPWCSRGWCVSGPTGRWICRSTRRPRRRPPGASGGSGERLIPKFGSHFWESSCKPSCRPKTGSRTWLRGLESGRSSRDTGHGFECRSKSHFSVPGRNKICVWKILMLQKWKRTFWSRCQGMLDDSAAPQPLSLPLIHPGWLRIQRDQLIFAQGSLKVAQQMAQESFCYLNGP